MIAFAGKALLALLSRIATRHVLLRRGLWLFGVIQFFVRRRRNTRHVVALRPGETLEMTVTPKIGK